jgi:hypothetical protein
MPSPEKIDAHHKALTLNLDPGTFGSFAEIGAGQDDDLYGSGSRYVSRQRLEAMLESEWAQLLA